MHKFALSRSRATIEINVVDLWTNLNKKCPAYFSLTVFVLCVVGCLPICVQLHMEKLKNNK